MENNKAYLTKMPYLLGLSAVVGILRVWLPLVFPFDPQSSFNVYQITGYAYQIVFYAGVGLVTHKWKEALICMAFSLALALGFNTWVGFTMTPLRFLYVFVFGAFPPLLFLYLAGRQAGKLPLSFLCLLIAGSLYDTSYYGLYESHISNLFFEINSRATVVIVFNAVIAMIGVAIQFLLFFELIHYNTKKGLQWKPRLLNLGNQYPGTGSFLLQVLLNLGLLMILLGGIGIADNMLNFRRAMEDYGHRDYSVPLLLTQAIDLVLLVPAVLLYGWYYRKFLIEHFVHYQLQSKTLYWLCCLPVIGIFAFGISQAEASEQPRYADKTAALSKFAGSSSQVIVVILSLFLILRFFMSIEAGPGSGVLTLLFGGGMLYWLISHPSGYYFNLYLNLLLLVVLCGAFIIAPRVNSGLVLIFGLLLYNIINVVLALPVFHMSTFEYIPAEDPENPEIDENNLLGDLVSQT